MEILNQNRGVFARASGGEDAVLFTHPKGHLLAEVAPPVSQVQILFSPCHCGIEYLVIIWQPVIRPPPDQSSHSVARSPLDQVRSEPRPFVRKFFTGEQSRERWKSFFACQIAGRPESADLLKLRDV